MDLLELYPPEVSSEIIAYACLTKHHQDWEEVISVDLLLDLTLVSSTWQAFIIGTPGLWADIFLDSRQEELALKLALQCELSRDHALSISVGLLNSTVSGDFLPLLDNHRHRIQELTVLDEIQLSIFFNTVSSLPCLKSLLCQKCRIGEATTRCIDQHPSLQVVKGIYVNQQVLTSNWLHCLREVDVGVPLHELVPHLDALSNIRHIRFKSINRPQGASLKPYKVHILPTLPWTRLTIDEWEANISVHFWQNLDVLVPALAQSLTELDCRVNFGLLSRLLSRLAEFTSIFQLRLRLIAHGTLDTSAKITQPSLVQKLYIETRLDFDSRMPLPEILPVLVQMMAKCFHNVTHLLLHGFTNSGLVPLLSREFLPKLRDVVLNECDYYYKTDIILSSTVQTLKFHSGGGPPDLMMYRSEGIREVALDYPFTSLMGIGEQQGLNLHLWPHLKKLHAHGGLKIDWIGSGLKNLRSITLAQGSSAKDPYQGTRLLYILSLYPHQFPVLTDLNLVPRIEWDILFCCLEARNTQKVESNVRIEAITFNGEIPFGFPELISRLLRGEEVRRPSNLNLSWIGNLDLLQDSNLPGCLECFKSLRYCQMTVMTQPNSVNLDLPTFDYPTSSRDVLLGWPTREVEWTQYVEWQQKSPHACGRVLHCGGYSLVTVTIRVNGYYVSQPSALSFLYNRNF